jgi:hypothetical protein
MGVRAQRYQDRIHALATTSQVRTQHVKQIMRLSNVVGAGVGYKVTASGPTDELGLIVMVTRKLPKEQLRPGDLVPHSIDGVPTDVMETGVLRALGGRLRPARPGCSIAHQESTAGTLGCLVERDGETYILSNNHVLALMNQANLGDPILQPGPADGGTLSDTIATLADFVPLDFGSTSPNCRWATAAEALLNWLAARLGSAHRVQSVKLTEDENRVDAALARPLSPDLVSADILDIGVPTGVSAATLGTRVKKSGRTTGFTTGSIQVIDLTVQINYDGPVAVFSGQLMASAMSQRGDSGSAVMDEQNRAIGLLFAGSDRATIINPIGQVLDALRVTVVTSQGTIARRSNP